MKPRLDPVPATFEDEQLWADTCARAFRRVGVRFATKLVNPDADRRDADLMFQLARCRGHPDGENCGQLGLGESGHPMPSLRLVERYFPFRPHRYDILNCA